METRPPRLTATLLIAVFGLGCVCVWLFLWRSFDGTTPLAPKGYQFHIHFGDDASQLTPGAEVRIAGIKVGTVRAVQPRHGTLDATVELERQYAPAPADTRAMVRYKTLLGESFVALTPGTRTGRKVPDGGTLRAGNVQPKQTIDKLLNTFDRPTRGHLEQFVAELDHGLGDRGADLNAFLGNAAPASNELARVAATIDAEGPALQRFVHASTVALDAVSARPRELQRLVTAGNDVLATTAGRDRSLTASIRELPSFQRELRATLAELDRTGETARPVIQGLRPVAPLIRPALLDVDRLAPQLRTAFARLAPVIASGTTALPKLRTTLGWADRLMTQLAPAGRQLVPILQLLGRYNTEVVSSLANGAAATQPIIGGHHGLRFMLTLNSQTLYGQGTAQGDWRSNPSPAPGAALDIANGKGALSCRHAHDPTTVPLGDGPPCELQKPWDFQGYRRLVPRMQPNRP